MLHPEQKNTFIFWFLVLKNLCRFSKKTFLCHEEKMKRKNSWRENLKKYLDKFIARARDEKGSDSLQCRAQPLLATFRCIRCPFETFNHVFMLACPIALLQKYMKTIICWYYFVIAFSESSNRNEVFLNKWNEVQNWKEIWKNGQDSTIEPFFKIIL